MHNGYGMSHCERSEVEDETRTHRSGLVVGHGAAERVWFDRAGPGTNGHVGLRRPDPEQRHHHGYRHHLLLLGCGHGRRGPIGRDAYCARDRARQVGRAVHSRSRPRRARRLCGFGSGRGRSARGRHPEHAGGDRPRLYGAHEAWLGHGDPGAVNYRVLPVPAGELLLPL